MFIKKKLILLTCFFNIVIFIQARSEGRYTIKGELAGLTTEKILLVDIGIFYRLKDNKVVLDSCYAKNGKFEFSGELDVPLFCAIEIPDLTKAYCIFILENGVIVLSGSAAKLHQSEIKTIGSENQVFSTFKDIRKRDQTLLYELENTLKKHEKNDESYHALKSDIKNLKQQEIDHQLEFIRQNRSSLAALHALDILLLFSAIDAHSAQESYDILSSNLKNSTPGKMVGRRIALLHSGTVDTVLPRFEDRAVDGKHLDSEEFKGKYTIIDFWATWCAPCLEQLPRLIKIREQYGDKIRLLSVSLDKDVAASQQVAAQHGITWMQVCDGKAGRGDLPLLFDVVAIPRVVICDSENKIIYDSRYSTDNIETALSVIPE